MFLLRFLFMSISLLAHLYEQKVLYPLFIPSNLVILPQHLHLSSPSFLIYKS
jgi:hypothetical protein